MNNLKKSNEKQICDEVVKSIEIKNLEGTLSSEENEIISVSERQLLSLICQQYQQNPDFSFMQKQILNRAIALLQNNFNKWQAGLVATIDTLVLLNRKKNAFKGAKSRDSKYASFRKEFKEIQQRRFCEVVQKGKHLSSGQFVSWFLKNKPKDLIIPYVKSNQINKLMQLAMQNNREFLALTSDINNT